MYCVYWKYGDNPPLIMEGVNKKNPISCGHVRKVMSPPPVTENPVLAVFFQLFLDAYQNGPKHNDLISHILQWNKVFYGSI